MHERVCKCETSLLFLRNTSHEHHMHSAAIYSLYMNSLFEGLWPIPACFVARGMLHLGQVARFSQSGRIHGTDKQTRALT